MMFLIIPLFLLVITVYSTFLALLFTLGGSLFIFAVIIAAVAHMIMGRIEPRLLLATIAVGHAGLSLIFVVHLL
ncbi:MAG: hypothetical protein FWF11_01970 [Coriobacteriia bacterium]|nr:hypothetical protein [Coriobacteriia bacterium]